MRSRASSLRTIRHALLFAVALVVSCASVAAGQTPAATLRVTVVDQTGAVIVGAKIELARPEAPAIARPSDARGEAVFSDLEPGRYALRVESAGFETFEARDLRVRGTTRREVRLAIAKISEHVQVERDVRERASDPRGDAFATSLGPLQIASLPDDPDELQKALEEMAGPGAVVRVNGFRGGRLPSKDQIQQIRFRRNMFAADTHEAGGVFVDIITRPGTARWRASGGAGFRDSALNARNAFAPVKGVERHDRVTTSIDGPLWRNHTSLGVNIEAADTFESRTIVAALPAGYFSDVIRVPTEVFNATVRVEHAATAARLFRLEFQRNHRAGSNLGVGDFDLLERAYAQTRTEHLVRMSSTGPIGRSLFNEVRVQLRGDRVDDVPVSRAPAVLVLNAFTAGGAQIEGWRRAHATEIADDLDVAVGRHAVRVGSLVEITRAAAQLRRNAGGTFTFASLDAFDGGQPTTYTRNVGDPTTATSLLQAAWYVEDDYRAGRSVTISGGMRHEYESHIGGVNLAPRGGVAWSPLASGRLTVRGGVGIFFNWLDAQTYEQAVTLDGSHQRIETIVHPGFPDVSASDEARVLPAGRVQFARRLEQPRVVQDMIGVEQSLAHDVRLNAAVVQRRGSRELRGVNVNAPLRGGPPPDPTSGPITEIESSARSQYDALSIGASYAPAQRRLFATGTYTLARAIDEADTVFSLPADSSDRARERGASATDARHRFSALVSIGVPARVRVGASVRLQSALPYTITTGRDDNGDTVSTDRPPGVGRNSARGQGLADVAVRCSRWIGFGVRANGGGPPGAQARGRGDGDALAGVSGSGDASRRYNVELYAQAYNLLNRTNPLTFSGVMTSPFFGRATSAAPPRRIEIGVRFSF